MLSAPHVVAGKVGAEGFSNQLRPRTAALSAAAAAAATTAAEELPEGHHYPDQCVKNCYRCGADGCERGPQPGRDRGACRGACVRARGDRGADGLAHRSDGVDDRRGAGAKRVARGTERAARGGSGAGEGSAQRGQNARADPRERGAQRGVYRADRLAESAVERPQHVLPQPVAARAEGLAARAYLVKGGVQCWAQCWGVGVLGFRLEGWM